MDYTKYSVSNRRQKLLKKTANQIPLSIDRLKVSPTPEQVTDYLPERKHTTPQRNGNQRRQNAVQDENKRQR